MIVRKIIYNQYLYLYLLYSSFSILVNIKYSITKLVYFYFQMPQMLCQTHNSSKVRGQKGFIIRFTLQLFRTLIANWLCTSFWVSRRRCILWRRVRASSRGPSWGCRCSAVGTLSRQSRDARRRVCGPPVRAPRWSCS